MASEFGIINPKSNNETLSDNCECEPSLKRVESFEIDLCMRESKEGRLSLRSLSQSVHTSDGH